MFRVICKTLITSCITLNLLIISVRQFLFSKHLLWSFFGYTSSTQLSITNLDHSNHLRTNTRLNQRYVFMFMLIACSFDFLQTLDVQTCCLWFSWSLWLNMWWVVSSCVIICWHYDACYARIVRLFDLITVLSMNEIRVLIVLELGYWKLRFWFWLICAFVSQGISVRALWSPKSVFENKSRGPSFAS